MAYGSQALDAAKAKEKEFKNFFQNVSVALRENPASTTRGHWAVRASVSPFLLYDLDGVISKGPWYISRPCNSLGTFCMYIEKCLQVAKVWHAT